MTTAEEATEQARKKKGRVKPVVSDDPNHIAEVQRVMGVTQEEATALAKGQYVLRYDSLAEYWDRVRPGAGEAIAEFMTALNVQFGGLREPHPELLTEIMHAFPWLWSPATHGVTPEDQVFSVLLDAWDYPRIALVTPERLCDVLGGDDLAWFDDILVERAKSELLRIHAETEASRARVKRQNNGCAKGSQPPPLIDPLSLELDDRSWLWPDIAKCEKWWKFRHFPDFESAGPQERETLWTHAERTIALAAELHAKRHREDGGAAAAVTLWKDTGNIPFALAGSGRDRTLYVLVKKPTGAN